MESSSGGELAERSRQTTESAQVDDEPRLQIAACSGRSRHNLREAAAVSRGYGGAGGGFLSACTRVCSWFPDFGVTMQRSQGAQRRDPFGLNELANTPLHRRIRYPAR